MAATIVFGYKQVPGSNFSVTATLTGDTSYPNPAGYVFTASSFNLNLLRKLIYNQNTTVAAAGFNHSFIPTYNADGVTIASFAWHMTVCTTGVEVANAVNVSTVSIQVTVDGN